MDSSARDSPSQRNFDRTPRDHRTYWHVDTDNRTASASPDALTDLDSHGQAPMKSSLLLIARQAGGCRIR